MCLYSIDKIEGIEKSGKGWKLFIPYPNGLRALCKGQATPYQENVWYEAKDMGFGSDNGVVPLVYTENPNNIQKYEAGFHMFKTKADAVNYVNSSSLELLVLKQVEYDDVICEGIQLGCVGTCDCVVAHKMRILPDAPVREAIA